MKKIYLIGSLRNPNIPGISEDLRRIGFDVFDDWHAPGPEADDHWKRYEQARGRSYLAALEGWAARHIYEFDKHHIDTADLGVLVCPAGKSGHLELGYMIGQQKPCFILLEPKDVRWDVMYQFANGIFSNMEDLRRELRNHV